jgi:hypothetical protein
MIDVMDTISHGFSVLLGGAGGLLGGITAERRAAKSDAVQELQMLKTEYKEFAVYTHVELDRSREERKECLKENEAMKHEIHSMKLTVNELSSAMHNIIGTPKTKRKPLNPNN